MFTFAHSSVVYRLFTVVVTAGSQAATKKGMTRKI